MSVVLAFILISVPALPVFPEGELAARVSSEGEMNIGLRLSSVKPDTSRHPGPPQALFFRFSVDEEVPDFRGGMRIGELSFGPGLLAARLRFLVDPAAVSPRLIEGGPAVVLDSSLRSRTQAIRLGSRGEFFAAEAFALSRAAENEMDAESAIGGLRLECDAADGSGGASFISAIDFHPAKGGGSGWKLDSPASLAGRGGVAALVLERRSPVIPRGRKSGSRAAAGIAASYGSLSGPGMAFRMESETFVGALRLGTVLGAAGKSYRTLLGEGADATLAANFRFRWELPRSARLNAEVELRSGAPHADPGPFARSYTLSGLLPFFGSALRSAEPSIGYRRSLVGDDYIFCGLGLSGIIPAYKGGTATINKGGSPAFLLSGRLSMGEGAPGRLGIEISSSLRGASKKEGLRGKAQLVLSTAGGNEAELDTACAATASLGLEFQLGLYGKLELDCLVKKCPLLPDSGASAVAIEIAFKRKIE